MKNSFAAIGKNVVQTEIDALKKLKKSINKDFDKIVNVILKCKGKIVFSGVGKSGIVSKKISSTLASIGIPTFYVDAGSCSHGDLGMISSNDVIILISHSGESEELKNIIKYAKRNRNLTLIGITSKKNSLLYKSSELKFLLPTITEAGPGNYIPTSSTTLQMCLGDALALSTIRQRKFSKLDFKKYHPSGSLGSKLKTVGELMFKGKDIPFVNENSNIESALKIFNKKNLGVLIARNSKGVTKGIISDGDFKRINYKLENINNLIIKNVMKKNPIIVNENMLAVEALSIMNTKKITALCVSKKKKNKVVGLIHMHNILKENIG
ncbi:KpsF/GutQ family sugar-phosphate isomerase [Candidatus Pelagibacter sp.]|nr:KpsF/GutQ family sugar-phosphate isomerase [Candidatus Pelagibacter sp.]